MNLKDYCKKFYYRGFISFLYVTKSIGYVTYKSATVDGRLVIYRDLIKAEHGRVELIESEVVG